MIVKNQYDGKIDFLKLIFCFHLLETIYRVNWFFINPLSAKFIKWSNTLKQFVVKLPTNCLSVFDHFSGLALKGLTSLKTYYVKV